MDAFHPADLSSRDRFGSAVPSSRAGKRQVKKLKSPRCSSDSISYSCDPLVEDTLAFDLRWASAHTIVGKPMKSLLAQEMSKQNESKRKSPSIIARLMGLDGLPSQSSSHKQRKPMENQQCRTRASEKDLGGSAYNGDRSFRKGSKEEGEFKDVFEVLDSKKVESGRNLYQGRSNSSLTEAEMVFIRQKFMEAKRLSTDEKLRHSKEFNDAIEALDSNKDLLLKFLQHPDSLFTRHLHDLQSITHKPLSSQVPSLKSTNGPNTVDRIKTQKADRELLWKSHRVRDGGGGGSPSHSRGRHASCDNNAFDLPQEELEERSMLQPTKIVVLKPNFGKMRNADRSLSSPSSSDEFFRADRRLPCTSNRDSEMWGRHKAYEDVSLSRHMTRETREMGKTVIRQVKTICASSGSVNSETSRLRGYAGDESSSGSDSASESELVPVAVRTRTTFNRRNHQRSLPSRSNESSVNREAKKRLSERWKLAHKSEQEREICRSSTLAEMLAISDREARPASFNGLIFEEGLSKRFDNNVGRSERSEPIGISSRDGWKGSSSSNPSKSRTIMHQESNSGYKIVIPKETVRRDGLVKKSSPYGEVWLSGNSRPSSNKSQSSYNTSPEINISPSSSKILYMDDGLVEQKLHAVNGYTSFSAEANSDIENGSNSEDTKTTLSFEPPNISAATSLTEPDISGGSTKEVNQPSFPEVQSQENKKEGDQPSPVSVLEDSFHDDSSSSSECFESVSADLQGLRMQLQLLKLESRDYEEGPMLVSSDEDAEQEESSRQTNEKLMTTQESQQDWRSFYLVDVLANSRFSDSDPDTFMATWHSSESPLTPSLFEELEKKYSNLKPSTRLERKFLFNRINEELLQIFQQFTDPHPWVKPSRICPKWDINRIQDALRDLVMNKEEKPRKGAEEKVLEEMEWLSLEDDIEVIGRYIEKLLTDELIAELVVEI
ncbi:PREDICTED: uncharacterized protein LOC104806591 [Tarenaya hassleriana]|uniref:uncharacterized protein LOC104806591 n=1 Tax=Tarenaya hassleriana TaxID=28532 RepID=UPI00053C83A1|nr:PREDICTED: uncharacterized protein LOC104806591 [Tarenaya hassleriana]